MKKTQFAKRAGAFMISALMCTQAVYGTGTGFAVHAEGNTLGRVTGVQNGAEKNVVDVTFENGVKGRITFLENGIFRYNIDPTGEFGQYAEPRRKEHKATIQLQGDDSVVYSKPTAVTSETETAYTASAGNVVIEFDKTTGQMSVLRKSGGVVFKESEPIRMEKDGTTQVLQTSDDEFFFGGGTQNGRFTHKGQSIHIANESGWTDGKVASPNPFYWSTKGYGVLRNTFSDGTYDFGKENASVVSTMHNEEEFDAYYFVSDPGNAAYVADSILKEYYEVTGNPALLPEYGFYLAHLNCYNRDGWQPSTNGRGWILEDGKLYNELGQAYTYEIPEGMTVESLNNSAPTVLTDNFKGVINEDTYKYSARAVIDGYADNDMPLGWFLPNDGYGSGYGQNGYRLRRSAEEVANGDYSRAEEAVAANVQNLKEFTQYANSKGVEVGLWTQAALDIPSSEKDGMYQGFHTLRDFNAEVHEAGVRALKTDVAWVGAGYSMALNSVDTGYGILATTDTRPMLVSLDGWAGSQRYTSMWTGDQVGGNWEYIRFHIPTYIGQSLSGNPNIGSDMDGIFGGNPIISTRDFQWKTFTPVMLDMDGWGSLAKKPYYNGDPYNGINRMYLKLKGQLMPYLYTEAQKSVDGLPMIRAIFLEEENPTAYAFSTATQYEFMYGDQFLVAPVYQNTQMTESGDDVRNGIYLPISSDTWIDYFTGEQYRGGQVLNNFEAPLWKLPLFVKNGAIIPMYDNHNNPQAKSDTNTMGLDKTVRIVEFYPNGTSEYTSIEDDGMSMSLDENKRADYGPNVKTRFTSVVDGTTATLTAEASQGTYNGYDSSRQTTFVVNVSKKPENVKAFNGDAEVELKEAATLEEYESLKGKEAVWFYDATPDLNKYSNDSDTTFKDTKITTTPKMYVAFTKTDVAAAGQKVVVEGFENDGKLSKDELNTDLEAPANLHDVEDAKTPTSITMAWETADGADSYEVLADGLIVNVATATEFNHTDLPYHSNHTYQVRSRNADGYSEWSQEVKAQSLHDPWKDTPDPVSITWTGGLYNNQGPKLAFNKIFEGGGDGFHSSGNAMGQELIVDYGEGLQLTKAEYYPRPDSGNGTVTQMEVYSSLDGRNWKTIGTFDWVRDNTAKEIPLNTTAQYLKFIPRTSVGNFFSASEIKVYKVEDTQGFAVGSIASQGKDAPSDADYTNMNNYLGISDKSGDTFTTQVSNYGLDINMNNIYDVYDYAYTMFKLDGGTKKSGPVTGDAMLVTDKETVKAGETFTVSVYAMNVDALNAFGQVLDYDPALVEVKKDDIKGSAMIAQMENLTAIQQYGDSAYVNLAFANRGDKKTYSGTGVIATITMHAKQDCNVRDAMKDLSTVTLLGPDFSWLESRVSNDVEIPDIPLETSTKYERNDFDMTMTNQYLPEDEKGKNIEKIVQGGSQEKYDVLFNGSFGREFEFTYDLGQKPLADEVSLPTTIHYTFKTPSPINVVNVYNANKGNGYLQAADVEFFYEDGTSSKLTIDTEQSVYEFRAPEENDGKKVKRVDVTPTKSGGLASELNEVRENRMLTLAEIEMINTAKAVIESIDVEGNVSEMYVGDIADVNATVNPLKPNPYYTVSIDKPEVLSLITMAAEDNTPIYKLHALTPGTAVVTVTSAGDPDVTNTFTVEVKEGVNTSELEKAIEKARVYTSDVFTPETYEKLQAAVNAGTDLLNSGEFTKDDVDAKTADIYNAIEALQYKELVLDNLINTSADTAVTVMGFSSECTLEDPGEDGRAVNVLDYEEESYWHSNYINDLGMPQYLMFDLGNKYNLTDITFLPRVNNGNGTILKAEVYVSEEMSSPETRMKREAPATDPAERMTQVGTYSFENNGEWKRLPFASTPARYVMFKITSTGGREADQYASMSEMRFYGIEIVNKDALTEKYEALKDTVNEGYTDETWNPFRLALDDAKIAIASDDLSQSEVDALVERLQTTFDALRKPGEPEPTPTPTPTPDPGEEGKTGWVNENNTWYFYEDGVKKTGWLEDAGTWYYLNTDGSMAVGWVEDSGNWYFLYGNGAMATGWTKLGNTWYFMYDSGAMATGWTKLGDTWYYMYDSGAMATGWVKTGSDWYYLYDNGAMATGWVNDGGTWYYMYANGAMAADHWAGNYYLQKDGSMATNKWIGQWYVGADGAWVKGKKR